MQSQLCVDVIDERELVTVGCALHRAKLLQSYSPDHQDSGSIVDGNSERLAPFIYHLPDDTRNTMNYVPTVAVFSVHREV